MKKIKRWREDPVFFVTDVFGASPDSWQVDVLRSFNSNQRIAMKASKGVGKSTILAWLAWNFLCTRIAPKMVATSISADNLSDGLWAELSLWQSKSEFLKSSFTWTKTRIFANENPENWFLSARTWAKGADSNQQADTLAGIHAERTMFILDECGGIPLGVMAAAEAGLSTGQECKIIMAGNPTHLEGALYQACTSERHLWFVKEITSDPKDPNRATRVSKEWAQEQIDRYGAENNFVLVNVYGKFPSSSLNSLLGPDEVAAAMGKHLTEDQYSFSQKRLGVDVARFGDDRSVIFPRQGLAALQPIIMRGLRSNELAARIMKVKSEFHSEIDFIDDSGGFGGGVIDSLIQAGESPMAVNFAGKAQDPRYLNTRAEIFFRMSEWVKRGGALPNIPELARELTAPTYYFQNGKFQLEPKDQIKARLGFSPDLADALALTFQLPEMPGQFNIPGLQNDRGKLLSDFDPFDPSR